MKYAFSDWARYILNLIKICKCTFKKILADKNLKKLSMLSQTGPDIYNKSSKNMQVHICYTQIESALKICLLKKYLQKLSMPSQTGPDIS